MRIDEEFDKYLKFEDNGWYTIKEVRDVYILRKIKIEKKDFLYAFIGGMWYSKKDFSLKQEISLPYPFSTYYTIKILDKNYNGLLCRSLLYVKMPLLVIQFEENALGIKFTPLLEIDGEEVFPFIALDEDDERYTITFYLFKEFKVKEKENAWLGIGRKKNFKLNIKPGQKIYFKIDIDVYRDWKEAVYRFIEKELPSKVKVEDAEKVFEKGKQALRRSYDNLTGSFIQLPWRDTTSFTFINSSYSLLSYEAVRLHYFTSWFKKMEDRVFREWSNRLRSLFINSKLYIENPSHGEGLIWYNMTNLTRNGLEGYFYMDCGYGGYPGGQGTIAFHLLNYLKYVDDEDIKRVVRKSLKYIISTQNKNGSWPMALHQEGLIRFRPEKLDEYESFNGTSESIRALLAGYKIFKDKKMLEAAFRGLNYLEDEYPICYNGLRDIGINEAEAFSAVSIIDAFIDAYNLTGDKKFLNNAINYAYYTLTYIYMYNTRNLNFKYNFHPISYSITPRLSPYESMWIISTYNRLYKITGDDLWYNISKMIYNETVKWQSRNGGISEGVFPKSLDKLEPLPMEQTFAIVELMQASTHFFNIEKGKDISRTTNTKIDPNIRIEKENNYVINIYYKNNKMLSFDVKKLKIIFIRNSNLNKYGISSSFYKPYSISSNFIKMIKKILRGRYGKFLLSISDIPFFIRGVENPRRCSDIKIHLIEDIPKKYISIDIDRIKANCICETKLHRFSMKINVEKIENRLHISFNPLKIEVLDHDIYCSKVLFPLIGAKPMEKKEGELIFDNFSISGRFPGIIENDSFTAVDQTLATNWTHGGVYEGSIDINIFD